MFTSAAFAGAVIARAVPTCPASRPDCLEIFAGRAEVSNCFSRWGWDTAEPVDILYGRDLRDLQVRQDILRWIEHHRPRLVTVAYPCKLWWPLTSIQYNTPQAKRRLHQLRKKDMPLLELCEEVFDLQIKQGSDALGENPLTSASFTAVPIANVLNHPDVYTAVGHGCRFGIAHAKSGKPLLKPTLWFSTSVEICDELGKRCWNETCPGHHEHDTCFGGAEVTAHAGVYTKQIAEAICKGYLRLLKRKEPSRIRVMLRGLSARIRNLQRAANGKLLSREARENLKSLRWSEKTVKRALDKWSAVLLSSEASAEAKAFPTQALGSGSAPPLQDRGDVEMRIDREHEAREVDASLRTELHSDGISFEVPQGKHVSEAMKQALKEMHCNLGHPSRADLERFLKLGGAKQEAIEAVGWMKCIACAHSRKPAAHRVSSIPPCQVVFGDEIQIDCIQLHDADKQPHWFLSVIDRATSYHMLEMMNTQRWTALGNGRGPLLGSLWLRFQEEKRVLLPRELVMQAHGKTWLKLRPAAPAICQLILGENYQRYVSVSTAPSRQMMLQARNNIIEQGPAEEDKAQELFDEAAGPVKASPKRKAKASMACASGTKLGCLDLSCSWQQKQTHHFCCRKKLRASCITTCMGHMGLLKQY